MTCARTQLLASIFLLVAAVGSSGFASSPVAFDIPTQQVPSALKTFTAQARVQVVYLVDELKDITAQPLKGSYLPAEGLAQLLTGTPCAFKQTGPANFTVFRTSAPTDRGSIQGQIKDEQTGRPVSDARVSIVGTSLAATTNRDGQFWFERVPSGVHALGIAADGMQNTRVTDVAVPPGQQVILGAIPIPTRARGVVQLEDYVVSARKIGGPIELDPYAVRETRTRAFSDANMDIPRTVDDPQAYYIYNRESIARSGAGSLDEFLRRRLTMDATTQPFAQGDNGTNTTWFNLRGFGSNQTLILIDGRRAPPIIGTAGVAQPDLNGIPISAVDRVEILPASASAIYGASAVGGVINVVLRRSYSGGEAGVRYENTLHGDSNGRRLDVMYGTAFENGRTSLMISLSQSKNTGGLAAQDRGFVADYRARLVRNDPSFYLASTLPPLGSTPNFRSANGTPLLPGNSATIAHISPGYAGGNSAADLAALRAGYNLAAPDTSASGGRRQRMMANSETESYTGILRRKFAPWLELFAEYRYSVNNTINHDYNALGGQSFLELPASASTNPFGQSVYVTFPTNGIVGDWSYRNLTRRGTVGFVANLPADWRVEGDYTYNLSRVDLGGPILGNVALAADLAAGVVDPVRDTLASPVDLAKYHSRARYSVNTSLDDFALRGHGPAFSLPAGPLTLSFSGEYRKEKVPPYFNYVIHTSPPNGVISFPAKSQETFSGHVEVWAPVVSNKRSWPGLRQLDLQLAARSERFEVGTSNGQQQVNLPYVIYSKSVYDSLNQTFGLRYRPFGSVLLRGSFGRGFVPPSYAQLLPNLTPTTPTVRDPRRGNAATVVTATTGANPDILPERSRNWNGGLVLEPKWLEGLRLSLDYVHIVKENNIAALTPQLIVNFESSFPERVTRGAPLAGETFGVGPITAVNARQLNLNRSISDSYDLAAGYRRRTAAGGAWTANLMATWWTHYKVQPSFNAPFTEYIGGAGYRKFGGNADLAWEKGRWTLGWMGRYYAAYRTLATYMLALGAEKIPAQSYHDVFASYRFPARTEGRAALWRMLERTELQLTIKNALDKDPVYDPSASPFLYNHLGDPLGANYVVSLRRSF